MMRILYNYVPNNQGSFSYRPVVCLTDQGPISREVLQKIYDQQWPNSGEELNFPSLGDLQQFSYLLLQKLGLKEGHLLSKESYNEGVREVNDREQFQEIFAKYGEVITNDELASKKNFLSKIFL